MQEVTDRLPKATAWDQPRAFAMISESVWWVTIVDATLVRYHPETYDRLLCEQNPSDRMIIDETLGGLRFVRNQMGRDVDHVDFIRPPGGLGGRVADWNWNGQAEPACEALSPDGREWELERYRAYQARLAGHSVGETFERAVAFLNLAATGASQVSGSGSR